MTTSLPNACRYAKASLPTRTTASGSSPLTWKIGAWIIRATSVLYTLDLEYCGAVVNPTWLLTTMCTVPAARVPHRWHGAVPAQLGQVQGLGHDALARERRIAVDQYGQH